MTGAPRCYVLDTSTFSDFRDSRRSVPVLRERIRRANPDRLFISVVTAEETLHGFLSAINSIRSRSSDPVALIRWYSAFEETIRDLAEWNILPYDESADNAFSAIPPALRRANSQDCRIAAIAISRGCTVVTPNTRHFSRIPGLSVENWSAENE